MKTLQEGTMQIASKFTIAVHILTAAEYFKESEKVTSAFLAGSIGANPVIIRNVMRSLKEAGMIDISQGKSGVALAKPLDEMSLYDVYRALDCVSGEGLFHFHANPNEKCPVGRHIHKALGDKLGIVQNVMEEKLKGISVADVVAATRNEIQHEDRQAKRTACS